VAGNVVYALLTSFVMFYLTDSLGLNMGIVGTLIAISKVLDAVTDLFFGNIMDRTHTQMGKARPWMLWPYIGCAVCLVACFAIPARWGEVAQYIFFFIAYTLLNAVFFTANNIAYGALTALITKNTNEQVLLGSFRFVFSYGTAMVIQYVTVDVVQLLGGGAEGWRKVAILYALIGLVINTISVLSVKELPEENQTRESQVSFLQGCSILLRNKYFLLICGSYFVHQIYNCLIGAGIYYAKYILGDEGLFSDFALAINIPLIVALTVVPLLIQKVGSMYKLNIWGFALATVGRIGVLVAGYLGSVPMMLLFTAVATLGIVPWQGDINALAATCCRHIQLTTGHSLDGMVYSCASFGVKIGGALGTPLCGWLLAATGYVENAQVQTAATINMLQVLYLWLPAILCGILLLLLAFLKVEQATEKLSGGVKHEGI
jgi:GPH family glycoside/pentoside/hexuronide:cation symporter